MIVKNIAAKLVRIMQDCSYVQKRGHNKFHNYKYALASDVLDKVGEACVKHGVATLMTPEILEVRQITTSKGNTEYVTTVKLTLTLVDAESGETLEIVGLGSGQDAGDKGLMKAETAAIKYAWMLTLNIATGDDPEADESVDERNHNTNTRQQQKASTGANNSHKTNTAPVAELASPEQRKKMFANAKESGATADDIKTLIAERFGIDSSSKLTKGQASQLIDYYEKQKGAKTA